MTSQAANSVDLVTIPEAETRMVSSKQSAIRYQVGDRISFSADLKPEWIQGANEGSNPDVELMVPEGSSPLRDLGWYLDPQNLWVAGGLRFVVSPLKSGKLTLPTLLIRAKSKDNHHIIARTHPLQMEVEELQAPEIQPEWVGPLSISLPTRYVVYGILIFLLLVGILVYLRRKFKRPKPVISSPPQKKTVAEHIVAIQKIEVLYQKNSYSPEAAKPIAFGITDSLKEFFSKRFEIDASESTTHELIQKLKAAGMAPHDYKEIQLYFEELDLIKFAAKEHQPHYSLEMHQNFKLKALALIQRWARAVEASS